MLQLCPVLRAENDTFDQETPGRPPKGWTATLTGSGESKWTVETDVSAPSKPQVLKQSGEGTFPICFKENVSIADGFVEVQFNPVAGKEDQAGGVIFRVKDKNNYYIARANALEDNVTIYHTIDGSRSAFKSISTKVAGNQWHTLRVDFTSNSFSVTFDGQVVITAQDNKISGAGSVGVWTKADSVTLFDNFSYGGK